MASRLRYFRARVLNTLFRAHTAIYELSDGRIGTTDRLPMLLLSVSGRKTGRIRTTPLVYFEDGERYVVVGSDGAARRDPQWWKNLQVNPRGSVRVGRRQFDVDATLAEDADRARLWELGKGVNPAWARYQTTTVRTLPVVVLSPLQR